MAAARPLFRRTWFIAIILTFVAAGLVVGATRRGQTEPAPRGKRDARPSHSSTIALTPNDQRLVVLNRESNSVSIIRVRDVKNDVAIKLAEVPVGLEPRCVAVSPNGNEAYVTNALSGTVSVVDVDQPK